MRHLDESLIECAHESENRVVKKCGTAANSANLLGNRIQCLENMFREVAGFLAAEFAVRRDGVPDQFETEDIGRAERRW